MPLTMTHPDIKDCPEVPVVQEAFDGCWQALGWQLTKARKKTTTATKSKKEQSDG